MFDCLEPLEPYYDEFSASVREMERWTETRVGEFTNALVNSDITQAEKKSCKQCQSDENPKTPSKFRDRYKLVRLQMLVVIWMMINPVLSFPVSTMNPVLSAPVEKKVAGFQLLDKSPFNAWDCNQPESITAYDMTSIKVISEGKNMYKFSFTLVSCSYSLSATPSNISIPYFKVSIFFTKTF